VNLKTEAGDANGIRIADPDQTITPATRQHRRILTDTLCVTTVKFMERRTLTDTADLEGRFRDRTCSVGRQLPAGRSKPLGWHAGLTV
jgi:hypothetical protein